MVSKYVAATLFSVALMTGVASAQTNTGNKNAANTSATMEEYSAYQLVGVNVYNAGNEKIGRGQGHPTGEIRQGRQGHPIRRRLPRLGEHYVAVPYDQVKWVDEPARSACSGAGTTTGSSTTTSSTLKWYPDHAEYNATKDQLKAMPEFKY